MLLLMQGDYCDLCKVLAVNFSKKRVTLLIHTEFWFGVVCNVFHVLDRFLVHGIGMKVQRMTKEELRSLKEAGVNSMSVRRTS